MGEGEGSSIAARGAQEEGERQERGFFGRIMGVLSPLETGEDADVSPDVQTDRTVQLRLQPGISNLQSMRVENVAVPRVEIVGVSAESDLAALVEKFRDSGFTRLPAYEGTLDSPIGMIHLKDLALSQGFNGDRPDFDLRALLRPLLYVPPSMPLGVLLQKMQSDRMHMALVIDEYGGVDGLVTIEDLIEQVVGDIEDEHDAVGALPWQKEPDGTYTAQARAPLDEFEAEIGLALNGPAEDDEVDTLGGLVFLLAGRVPSRGEVIRHPDGPEFEVIDADPRRIKRMRVRLPSDEA